MSVCESLYSDITNTVYQFFLARSKFIKKATGRYSWNKVNQLFMSPSLYKLNLHVWFGDLLLTREVPRDEYTGNQEQASFGHELLTVNS